MSYYKIEFSKAASHGTYKAAAEQAAMLAEKSNVTFWGNGGSWDDGREAVIETNSRSTVSARAFENIPGVLSVRPYRPTY